MGLKKNLWWVSCTYGFLSTISPGYHRSTLKSTGCLSVLSSFFSFGKKHDRRIRENHEIIELLSNTESQGSSRTLKPEVTIMKYDQVNYDVKGWPYWISFHLEVCAQQRHFLWPLTGNRDPLHHNYQGEKIWLILANMSISQMLRWWHFAQAWPNVCA